MPNEFLDFNTGLTSAEIVPTVVRFNHSVTQELENTPVIPYDKDYLEKALSDTSVSIWERLNLFASNIIEDISYIKYMPVAVKLILFIINLKGTTMDENTLQADVKLGTDIAHSILDLVGVTKKLTDPTWVLIKAAEDAIIAASYAVDRDLKVI